MLDEVASGKSPRSLFSGSNPPGRLLIVESVTKKRSVAGPAKDVYDSRLWSARRRYAERSRLPWLILSARHGLLEPEEPIEPYELRLTEIDGPAFEAVADRALAQLEALYSLDGLTVEAHVRERYADRMADALVARGARLEQPLRGLSICGQLSWYRGDTVETDAACSVADAT